MARLPLDSMGIRTGPLVGKAFAPSFIGPHGPVLKTGVLKFPVTDQVESIDLEFLLQ